VTVKPLKVTTFMADIVNITESNRGIISPLFSRHTHLRAVIDSVLEGRLGTASVDREASPRTARLVLGVYTFLAGDTSTVSAKEFVSQQSGPCEFIVADDSSWESLIDDIHGKRITRRTMDAFVPDTLDLAHLNELASNRPDGVEIAPITVEDAIELGSELEPNRTSIFGSPEEFVRNGLGVCAREAGNIVAAATSYSISSQRVEIAIATHANHRRRGLAVSVGATMMIQCIEQNLEPHWTAGNPVSTKVALRLGYRCSGQVTALCLPA
jgi:hypothetical protein